MRKQFHELQYTMVRRVFLLLLAVVLVITSSAQMNRNADNQNDMKKRQIEGEISKLTGQIQIYTNNEARYKEEMGNLDEDIPPDWYVEQDRVALQREYDQLKREESAWGMAMADTRESDFTSARGYRTKLGLLRSEHWRLSQRQNILDQKSRDLDRKVAVGKANKIKRDEWARKLALEWEEKKMLEWKVDDLKRELANLPKG